MMMSTAILFVKESLLIYVPVKALEAVEAGQKLPSNLISFLTKLNLLKDFFTTALTALHKWGRGAHQTSNHLPKPNL